MISRSICRQTRSKFILIDIPEERQNKHRTCSYQHWINVIRNYKPNAAQQRCKASNVKHRCHRKPSGGGVMPFAVVANLKEPVKKGIVNAVHTSISRSCDKYLHTGCVNHSTTFTFAAARIARSRTSSISSSITSSESMRVHASATPMRRY
jgi:hypothetical protein